MRLIMPGIGPLHTNQKLGARVDYSLQANARPSIQWLNHRSHAVHLRLQVDRAAADARRLPLAVIPSHRRDMTGRGSQTATVQRVRPGHQSHDARTRWPSHPSIPHITWSMQAHQQQPGRLASTR